MIQIRKALIGGGLAAAAIAGGALGESLFGNAQAATVGATTVSPAAAAATPGTRDPGQGGHVGANGTRETLLTGATAAKVKAAALKAVPGGTIERVETDAEGAVYEAHMTKADGSEVTVKFDAAFKVTAVETGRR